ncbi:MAG: hypothetical protein DMG38_09210 [Acidobacteria bacterium]|nr:MAG: hypothetical protein DMG38_09210 [Acidobacteriota bacterium]
MKSSGTQISDPFVFNLCAQRQNERRTVVQTSCIELADRNSSRMERRQFLQLSAAVTAGLAFGRSPMEQRLADTSLSYMVLDVFTGRPFAGNPLANCTRTLSALKPAAWSSR